MVSTNNEISASSSSRSESVHEPSSRLGIENATIRHGGVHFSAINPQPGDQRSRQHFFHYKKRNSSGNIKHRIQRRSEHESNTGNDESVRDFWNGRPTVQVNDRLDENDDLSKKYHRIDSLFDRGFIKAEEIVRFLPVVNGNREKLERIFDRIIQFYIKKNIVDGFDVNTLVGLFLNPTTVCFELGKESGIIILQNVREGFSATVHVFIWGKDLIGISKHTRIFQELQDYVLEKFNLHRLQASIPKWNTLSYKMAERMGWKREGIQREAGLFRDGKYYDVFNYSFMR